jgi:hypothetical protein
MLPVRICAGGVGTTGVPTATGQHRDDDVNGLSRPGEVKRKEAEIAKVINPALLRRHTGVLRKSKN